MATQIKSDFKGAFEQKPNKSASQILSPNHLRLLAQACLVVATMTKDGETNPLKDELLEYFIDIELQEYKALFQDNQDLAWLDKVDKRFNWLKKHLIEFEERFGRMFPPKWEVSECITVEFCKVTANQLSRVMSNRHNELNVRLLLYAFNKTVAFENLLNQRFTGITLLKGDLKNETATPFTGLIAHCFEPHFKIYVDAQEKALSQMIEQLVADHQKQKQETDRLVSEVFSSAGILFSQYKNCLVQCVQLSTGRTLVDLSLKFKKNLEDYATLVLTDNLPRLRSTLGLSSSGVLNAAISAAGLLQLSLKDGEVSRYSKFELCQICSVLLTANYCLETVQQLEKKLQDKVEPSLAEQINMSAEQDMFHR